MGDLKWLLSTAIIFALGACTLQAGIEQTALDYNRAADKVDKELLLLNIARAYRGEDMTFTGVSEMRGSFTVKVSGSADVPFGGDAESKFGISPSASYQTSPSTKIVPLATDEFQKGIVNSVTPRIALLLWERGWPKELLLHLLIDKIVMKVPEAFEETTQSIGTPCWKSTDDEFEAPSVQTKPVWEESRESKISLVCEIVNEPDDEKRFREFQELLRAAELQLFELQVPGDRVGPLVTLSELDKLKTVAAAHDGPLKLKETKDLRYFLSSESSLGAEFKSRLDFLPNLSASRNASASEIFDYKFKRETANREQSIDLNGTITSSSIAESQSKDIESKVSFEVHLRSPQGMIFYLGQIIRAEMPLNGSKARLVSYQKIYLRSDTEEDCDPRRYSIYDLTSVTKLKKNGCLVPIFVARKGDGRAEVSVELRGERFFIPSGRLPQASKKVPIAGRSLMAMTLVRALFNMSTSRQDLPSTQTVVTAGSAF